MENRVRPAVFGLLLSFVPMTGSAAEQAQTTPECIAEATPKFTFSVADEDTQASFAAFHQRDVADDGQANWDARLYLAHLAHLPAIKPAELPHKTYQVYRWFPFAHLHENGDAPAIRVFLRQVPLLNPEGVATNEAPAGAVVYLPRHGQATDALTAAEQFVAHLCQLRTRLNGNTIDL